MISALSLIPRRRLLIGAVLLLGLALRSYHYLRDRAVWQDEAGLLLTVLERGFGDLFLGRLDYHQAAPPLYLCVLKATSLIFGDSSHALRLPSFAASCAALLLFAVLARRLLVRQAVPWAVLLFACSEQLLWHASEAKAYSFDILAGVLVLAACRSQLSSTTRQLLVYLPLAPLLLLSSYPACFLCVGVLLAYLPVVLQRGERSSWLAYGALAVTMATVVSWLVLGPVRSQNDAEIQSCWVSCMPNWERPWTMPGWLALSSFEVCRYCCKPLGQFLAVLVVPGALKLWQGGERTMVRLTLSPIVLAAAAACAHRYPFGGARVMAFAAPAILLLAASGVPPSFAWIRRTSARPHWRFGLSAALTVLLLLPLGSTLEQVFHPWSEADVPAAAAFVREHCQERDLILGNDVAQQYYFRGLGATFHLLDESPLPTPPENRLWVVMTAAVPRAERMRLASHLAPSGWRARQQSEFAFTTVLLFAR